MARLNRTSTTVVLLACLLSTQWTAANVFASDEAAAADATRPAQPIDAATLEPQPRLVIDPSRFTLADESSALAQRRGGFRGRGRTKAPAPPS